ncbi:hypothetical protein [Micromonospora deserti]|uniref:Uncharacterized protein n=1 Tax=Micromonospora deserti TaxID=2070366 RepID=A0A2W2DCG3_9ACTN|nr:hypothetical protein [Micromonospora deserti]PZF98529.1 hypothetical protein C1I99_13290 [Micromonospora deserti]
MASLFGRTPPPVDPVDPDVRHAQLTARHDQALAYIEQRLRTAGPSGTLTDALLDVRNLLRPPERPS